MSARRPMEAVPDSAISVAPEADLLTLLPAGRPTASDKLPPQGVVIGELVGMDAEATPLVLLPGQTIAHHARSVVDLHRHHIGKNVALVFEENDWNRPIIIGVLREAQVWPATDPSGQVEVDVNRQRMIVSARDELVLRCGAASITLDREGRIIIRGKQVVSHSEGVNRIRGGSVQLN